MTDQTVLDVKKLVEESMSMPGALGAISYAVLKGLLAGGADEKTVAGVRVLMQEHFPKLSDNDCNALCDLVYARLQKQATNGGKWYGA